MIDLHIHTIYSDGTFTPEQVVDIAMEKKLSAIAITDHDSMKGVYRAFIHGCKNGLRVVPGVEISSSIDKHTLHMVALWPNIRDDDELLDLMADPKLQGFLSWIRDGRDVRNMEILQRLRDGGFDIPNELLGDEECTVTRANIALAMVKQHYAETVSEAMATYLSKSSPYYVPRRKPSPEQCIEEVHSRGGLIFVAHYHQIAKKDLEYSADAARRLIEMGVDGLETRYCQFDEEMQATAEQIAGETGCLRSGGSDFHGEVKPGLELGTGYGTLAVPDEFLVRMEMKA